MSLKEIVSLISPLNNIADAVLALLQRNKAFGLNDFAGPAAFLATGDPSFLYPIFAKLGRMGEECMRNYLHPEKAKQNLRKGIPFPPPSKKRLLYPTYTRFFEEKFSGAKIFSERTI